MATESTNPHAAAAVNRLRAWAISPEGGGKIFKWGTSGDFERCRKFYREGGKVPAHMLDGWCSNLHRLALGGKNPGEH